MASPDAYPCRRRVPWRFLEPEALVIDVKAGLLYPLNSVGARIWQLSDGDRTVREIVRILIEEFDADEATIRDDAMRFIDELAGARLISMESAPGAGDPNRAL